jgi:protein Mpv17
MIAGAKLWPLVSILNFSLVPMERRVIVGALVGLFWNIYLSIVAG